ncbi:hypothetical protein AT6N2_C1631 [Agrobacterium tumefaciens]|uniref:hypothetical protein n=1 Tax=Agrobacterium tumefaciens TaxID=358 RepID=UPI001ADA9B60|nr:hypothetical protein [Agrobacterium tumefaciens]QTK79346.1 hypothetical protein AT6N2_C1631 [Agrobacterium tumefaciens]
MKVSIVVRAADNFAHPKPDHDLGNATALQPLSNQTTMEDNMLKGIALWAMGVPVFVIILLYMFVF